MCHEFVYSCRVPVHQRIRAEPAPAALGGGRAVARARARALSPALSLTSTPTHESLPSQSPAALSGGVELGDELHAVDGQAVYGYSATAFSPGAVRPRPFHPFGRVRITALI